MYSNSFILFYLILLTAKVYSVMDKKGAPDCPWCYLNNRSPVIAASVPPRLGPQVGPSTKHPCTHRRPGTSLGTCSRCSRECPSGGAFGCLCSGSSRYWTDQRHRTYAPSQASCEWL